MEGQWHSVIYPPHPLTKPVRWYNRLNPIWWFGNRNEPEPPDWYRPNGSFRTLTWYCRNPMANFTWYVIGVADKETVRAGKYPDRITRPGGGWNFAVTKWKWLRFPFVAYSHKSFVFYLGWRERGNFGAALRFNAQNDKSAAAKKSSSTKPTHWCATSQCKTECQR
jgi:hypothetical protein